MNNQIMEVQGELFQVACAHLEQTKLFDYQEFPDIKYVYLSEVPEDIRFLLPNVKRYGTCPTCGMHYVSYKGKEKENQE